MSTELPTPHNDDAAEVPFGASGLPPLAIVGLIGVVAPFVVKIESWSSTLSEGVATVSYSDPVAMAGGLIALLCGLFLLVGAVRKRPLPPTAMTWGLVAVLGAGGVWHALRGFGLVVPGGVG